jgi:ornithine cyclodeaminase/alanine dehydrogenase
MTTFLDDDALAGVVDLAELIDTVRTLHIDLALGHADQPVPALIDSAPSTLLLPMVATSRRLGLTVVKVLTDAQDNFPADAPVQQSTIVLLDATTGNRLAVMAGSTCTRMRTAATSAAATDALARTDSRVLGLVGAGPLAVEHIAAIRKVRPIDTVVVWSRTPERIRSFRHALGQRDALDRTAPLDLVVAPDARGVVETADILCTLTPARDPVIHGDWFHPGLHVNAVGAPPRPDHREIDSTGMARATVVVDSTAVQLRKSGEVLLALREGATTEQHFRRELGDVLAGLATGRATAGEITLFNSVGLALQDLAFAALATGQIGRAGAREAPPDYRDRQPALPLATTAPVTGN